MALFDRIPLPKGVDASTIQPVRVYMDQPRATIGVVANPYERRINPDEWTCLNNRIASVLQEQIDSHYTKADGNSVIVYTR